MPITVLIADDHQLVRAGLRALVDDLPNTVTVAEAGDGAELLELVQEHRPDLVLVDVQMPRLNGLEALARLRHQQPDVRVLVLSMHSNEEYVLGALDRGADGYLLKDAAPTELATAIATVMRGERYLGQELRQRLERYRERLRGATSPLEQLTSRQREVLQLVAEGYTTKRIAATLGISVKTVEAHRTALMRSLDLHDLASLVRFAVRHGLVASDEA